MTSHKSESPRSEVNGATQTTTKQSNHRQSSTPPGGSDDKRPFVETSPDLHVLAEACELALAKDARVFVRDGKLGRLIRQQKDAELRWYPFGLAALRRTVGEYVRFHKWKNGEGDKRTKEHVKVPEDAAEALRQQGAWSHLRTIHRIVRAPFLRADGTLCQAPGYDAASGMFGDFAKGEFPRVPEHPTQADAAKALRELVSTFRDFPFDGDASRYATIAAILTLVGREAIGGAAPLFMVSANTRGAGKSLLVNVISAIATGDGKPASAAIPEKEEEWSKTMTSLGIARKPMVNFDNARNGGVFGSPTLDSALTSGKVSGRLMATNDIPEVEIASVFFVTGNNVGLADDTRRRTLPIVLESSEENPEDRRDFTIPNIVHHALTNRPKLLACALTVLAGFVAAQRPRQRVITMGSFETWSELIASAIVWAGGADPQGGILALRSQDDARGALGTLLEIMSAWIMPTWTAAEALERLSNTEEGRAALDDFCPPPRGEKRATSKSFGRRLAHAHKRVVNGKRFVRCEGNAATNAARWRVENVGTKPAP